MKQKVRGMQHTSMKVVRRYRTKCRSWFKEAREKKMQESAKGAITSYFFHIL